MKSFRQILAEVVKVKTIQKLYEQIEPVDHSVNERVASDHPHSVLHEIMVHAHLNRLIRGDTELEGHHFSPEAKNYYQKAMERTKEKHNTASATGKSTRRPSVDQVHEKAKTDAENIYNELKNSHGWDKNTRAHWTPTTSSRRELHPDESHSGDITVVNHETNKSTAPSASINLKWGKGTSLSVPNQSSLSSSIKGKLTKRLTKRINKKFKQIKRDVKSRTTQQRDSHIGQLAQHHTDAFNALSHEEKKSFVKGLYGVSDSPTSKITSYTHHSGSQKPINNHEHYNKIFPESETYNLSAVRHGRGMRILKDEKHLRTLSWRYNRRKLEPNLKKTKNEKE